MVFHVDVLGIDGRTLDLVQDPGNPHRVSGKLLR